MSVCMKSLIVGVGLALCSGALAQAPPPASNAPLRLTFDDALSRARANSPLILQADVARQMAREDTIQAKAALLPSGSVFNQFIYTQPNGTPSGVFVSNDGPHIYNAQAAIHGEIYSPEKVAGLHRSQVAEALLQAKAEVAARGLVSTVVAFYYGMAAAGRKLVNAQQALNEANHFLDITKKQEAAGEVSHADVVKAQIQVELRQRDEREAGLALEKARVGFAVLLFPDYRQDFTVVDDMDSAKTLPPLTEVKAAAARNNPDIRAAQAAVDMQGWEIKAARAQMLPSLSFDYFFGINSTQLALHNEEGLRNYGSVAQAQLNIPIWTWGAARSRVRQAELGMRLARNDLTYTQRQLLANLDAFYREADTASFQIASLRESARLAADSLRLTELQYEAGDATALEVVEAQATLVDARNAYDDGLARYRVALADLQTLTGAF
jgi:outer membrane protein TolC